MVLSLALLVPLFIDSGPAATPRPESTETIDAAFENSASDGTDDDSAEKVDEESAELEELRALEEVALDPSSQSSAEVLRALRRLGLANPLRGRLLDAANPQDYGEPENYVLGPVSNLATLDVEHVRK